MVNIKEWILGEKPTEKVYLLEPYVRVLRSKLMDYVRERSTKYYIILDKSVFHPKGGGQPSDVGWLVADGLRFEVRKVIDVNGVLVHYGRVMEGSIPEIGSEVKSLLDWERRYRVMRIHTAGHIIDYAISEVYGHVLNTLGAFHGPPNPYVIYEGYPPSMKELNRVEEIANEIVKESLSVKAFFVGSDELRNGVVGAPNLSRLPQAREYRIVSIEGVNAMPCTGTHVRNTEEVGKILIKGADSLGSNSFRLNYDVS